MVPRARPSSRGSLRRVVERWLPLESPWTYVVGVSFAVLLGLSVLAHEMAHAVMAQRFGLRVRSMTIHLIGGVTAMDAETRRPWVDFTIAVVGPLMSLLVGGVAWLGYLVAPEGTVFAFVTWQLMAANLVVGALNLVPALPLDGGRLLRDVVWAASGREHIGTIVAGWTGRAFAVLVAFLAVLPVLLGRPDVVWLAWGLLLAGFIWVEASRSLKFAGVSRAIAALKVVRPGSSGGLRPARHPARRGARAPRPTGARPWWSPMHRGAWPASFDPRPRSPCPRSGARGCPSRRWP